ncbi:hypothetical protein AGMMS49975_19330 [Clostridia bacterium]|nr:hypothetical protein AGMMS49975_19330 [Clostridia bacterium]
MGRTMSSRSAVIIPITQGNRTHRDPGLWKEGRAVPERRTDEGEQYGHTEVLGYTVNETAADSGSGPETPGRKFGKFGTSY